MQRMQETASKVETAPVKVTLRLSFGPLSAPRRDSPPIECFGRCNFVFFVCQSPTCRSDNGKDPLPIAVSGEVGTDEP
jgi:hypothetical protein